MVSLQNSVSWFVKRSGAVWFVLLAVSCEKSNHSSLSDEAFVDEARQLTDAFQEQLKSELMQAMQSGGPGAAIEVCHERAPQIADQVRRQRDRVSWGLSRTALRVRNPDNAPTDWQRRGLGALQQRMTTLQKGSDPSTGAGGPIEWHARAEDGSLRYLRAIPMGPLCSTCHGDGAQLPPIVKQRLAELYPQDQATGFSMGELRGAFVVTAPRE